MTLVLMVGIAQVVNARMLNAMKPLFVHSNKKFCLDNSSSDVECKNEHPCADGKASLSNHRCVVFGTLKHEYVSKQDNSDIIYWGAV